MLAAKSRGEELSKKDYDDLVTHLCKKTISAVQLGRRRDLTFSGLTIEIMFVG